MNLSGMDSTNKKDGKSANMIIQLAKEKNIPIKEYAKHDLNMLSDNRPHQGFILRCSGLSFHQIDSLEELKGFKCVLALDEVWDPQNFGALLRKSQLVSLYIYLLFNYI
jgi:21S rRNA (GM2251-2'-O)-methyltransferase